MVSEIISRGESRRDWPDEIKVRIVGEALATGVTAVSVANRNGVCRSLLYMWLRLARQGRLPRISINASPSTFNASPDGGDQVSHNTGRGR